MSNRCMYNSTFADFIQTDTDLILGRICDCYHGQLTSEARYAWKFEIEMMKDTLQLFTNESGQIVFEYDIPRLGKRIDIVLLLRGIIFCLEFKVGESDIYEADVDQVLDYALDLNSFHRFSQGKIIAPILIATRHSNTSIAIQSSGYDSHVLNPLVCGASGLSTLIRSVINQYPNEAPVNNNWIISPYAPTPTIIEAARSLYENHSVEDIMVTQTNPQQDSGKIAPVCLSITMERITT